MANYAAFGALRQRLGMAAPSVPSRPASPHLRYPFADSLWRTERALREAVDSFIYYNTRWRVTVLPSDRAPRHFILRGTLDHVTRRAHSIFADQTRVLAIEPAPHLGGEMFDRRLSLSHQPKD